MNKLIKISLSVNSEASFNLAYYKAISLINNIKHLETIGPPSIVYFYYFKIMNMTKISITKCHISLNINNIYL